MNINSCMIIIGYGSGKNLDHVLLVECFTRKTSKCSPEAEVLDLTKRPDIILGLQERCGAWEDLLVESGGSRVANLAKLQAFVFLFFGKYQGRASRTMVTTVTRVTSGPIQ